MNDLHVATDAPYWLPALDGLSSEDVQRENEARRALHRRMTRQATFGYYRFLNGGGAAEHVIYEDVPPEQPVPGWKGLEAFTHERNHRRIWPPVLGNLCLHETRFPGPTAQARCTARPHPCTSPPRSGCPAECGIFAAVALAQLRWGIDVGVVGLVNNWGRVIGERTDCGEAWRAEHCRLVHLLIAPMYARSGSRDAVAGFEKRYGVPVTIVDGPELLPYVPLGNFVEAAEGLGLPAVSRE